MTSEPSPTQFLTPARLWLSPRVRFIGPFLVAGLLGWAGVLRLRPALGATAQLARQQADGAQRVQALERQLREIEPNPPAEAGNALLESLHADPAGVVPWLSEAEREARRRGWILRSEVGEVSVRTLSGRDLVRVPVRFHLTPESGPPDSPAVGRLLHWGEWILQHPQRPEVQALSLAAGATGLRECRMDLELRFIATTP